MMSSLNGFLRVLAWDFKLQLRYYFWTVALVVTVFWLSLFYYLSEELSVQFLPVLIFADISQIGLVLIGGILFLERRLGTLSVSAVMPISATAWLAAKLVSLSLLCACCALTIVVFNVASVNWLRLIPAITLTAALFTSIGFLLVCPFERVMNYFLLMVVALGVLGIPVLAYLEIFESGLMWILPSQPAMWVLRGSLQAMPASAFYLSLLLLLAWICLLHWLGVKSLRRARSLA